VGGSGAIGMAVIEELISEGHDCIATYFKSKPKKQISEKIVWRKLNLRNYTDTEEFIENLEDIDSVIFCAGVSIAQKVGSIGKNEMLEMFEVNIISVIQITNALIAQIQRKQFFRLVFLSSIVGSSGGIGLGVYASTKLAIEGFALSLNREFLKLKKINPQCNLACAVIRLGYTDTPMTSGLNPKIRAAIEERTTLNRFLKPNEVSYLISYLLRPESEGFTGSIIDFNGGVNL